MSESMNQLVLRVLGARGPMTEAALHQAVQAQYEGSPQRNAVSHRGTIPLTSFRATLSNLKIVNKIERNAERLWQIKK